MSDSATDATRDSYYGRPILKAPVWTWEIPVYFFFGGMAGAAAPFALLSELRGDEALARRAWLVGLAGAGASRAAADRRPRPARALPPHAARVQADLADERRLVGPRRQQHGHRLRERAQLISPGSRGWARQAGATAVLGPALSTYTAVLVADTAVPAWHEARSELPFVFAAGAAMSAGAAVALIGGGAPARRLALLGAAGELTSTTVMERRLGPLGEPYREGAAGHAARAAKALTAAGGLVMALRGGRRAGAAAGGALMLAGAMATRWSVFRAGFQSAADPKYVVGPQRARMAARAEASAR